MGVGHYSWGWASVGMGCPWVLIICGCRSSSFVGVGCCLCMLSCHLWAVGLIRVGVIHGWFVIYGCGGDVLWAVWSLVS